MILAELFNKPQPTTVQHDEWEGFTYNSTLSDGSKLVIEFGYAYIKGMDNCFNVAFKRTGKEGVATYSKTGHQDGSEIEVMSTVVNTIKGFIAQHDPNGISFSAAKPMDDARSGSRASLYDRLIKSLAANKFDVERNEQSGSNGQVYYTLIKKGVTPPPNNGWEPE